MLKKTATGLLTATALGAAALAGAAPATAVTTAGEPAPSSPGPITVSSWVHSGYYPDGGSCAAALALRGALGYDTIPFRAPCDYTPWVPGYYFHYWA